MGFLDRLFGGSGSAPARPVPRTVPTRRIPTEDERAIERYRYLIRTAPPETIEQVHAEAFARLTDEQRALIYEELSRGAGTGERPLSSEPATLARAATRAELRTPGALERVLQPSAAGAAGAAAPGGAMPGFGSMFAGSLLGSVAGYVVGSALVSAFLPWDAAYDTAGSADAVGADAGTEMDAAGDLGGFGDFGGFDI